MCAAPVQAARIARTAGVECRVNGAVVKRVGAYSFADARDAAMTYRERLAGYDVAGNRRLPGGKSGDAGLDVGRPESREGSDRV